MESFLSRVVPFLPCSDILQCLLCCKTWMRLGFEQESEIAARLLNDFAIYHRMAIRLENESSSLLRGLASFQPSGVSTCVFSSPVHPRGMRAHFSGRPFPTFCQHSSPQTNRKDCGGSMGSNPILAPFTSILRNEDGTVSMRLSMMQYFEVSFSTLSHQQCPLGIGVAAKAGDRSGDARDEYYLFNGSGSIFHNAALLTHDSNHCFQPGDVVGCGMISPPVAPGAGQIFFTKNGELTILTELSGGSTGLSWFPFSMCSADCHATLLFGDQAPFAFRRVLFEGSVAAQSAVAGLPFEQLQWEALRTAGAGRFALFVAAVQRLQQNTSSSPPTSDKACHDALLLKIAAQCQEDRTSFRSYRESDDESHVLSVLSSHTLDSAQPGFRSYIARADSQASSTHTFIHPVNSKDDLEASKVTSRPSAVSFMCGLPTYQAADGEEDGDWCQDSMAVELSSVDSFAVQEMRECAIYAGSPPMIARGAHMASGRAASAQVHQHSQYSWPSSPCPRDSGRRPRSGEDGSRVSHRSASFSKSSSSCSSYSGSSVHPARGANPAGSDPNRREAGENSIRSRSNSVKDGRDSSICDDEDNGENGEDEEDEEDEEGSVTTSLIVELASLDEDGLYMGYGDGSNGEPPAGTENVVEAGREGESEDEEFNDERDAEGEDEEEEEEEVEEEGEIMDGAWRRENGMAGFGLSGSNGEHGALDHGSPPPLLTPSPLPSPSPSSPSSRSLFRPPVNCSSTFTQWTSPARPMSCDRRLSEATLACPWHQRNAGISESHQAPRLKRKRSGSRRLADASHSPSKRTAVRSSPLSMLDSRSSQVRADEMCYWVPSSSPATVLSGEKNECEDGYDGASETGECFGDDGSARIVPLRDSDPLSMGTSIQASIKLGAHQTAVVTNAAPWHASTIPRKHAFPRKR